VVDAHPDYRSRRHGEQWSGVRGHRAAHGGQHHHRAPFAERAGGKRPRTDQHPRCSASCSTAWATAATGTLWGGEFLLAGLPRLPPSRATLPPQPRLPAGNAARAPWWSPLRRCLPALQIGNAQRRWAPGASSRAPGPLEFGRLARRQAARDARVDAAPPRAELPTSSSCGRAVSTPSRRCSVSARRHRLRGPGRDRTGSARRRRAAARPQAYAFATRSGADPRVLDPAPLWEQLFADLGRGVARSVVAARFHARRWAAAAVALDPAPGTNWPRPTPSTRSRCPAACSRTGCCSRASPAGCAPPVSRCWPSGEVPANDGGLSLGQAAIGAAHSLR